MWCARTSKSWKAAHFFLMPLEFSVSQVCKALPWISINWCSSQKPFQMMWPLFSCVLNEPLVLRITIHRLPVSLSPIFHNIWTWWRQLLKVCWRNCSLRGPTDTVLYETLQMGSHTLNCPNVHQDHQNCKWKPLMWQKRKTSLINLMRLMGALMGGRSTLQRVSRGWRHWMSMSGDTQIWKADAWVPLTLSYHNKHISQFRLWRISKFKFQHLCGKKFDTTCKENKLKEYLITNTAFLSQSFTNNRTWSSRTRDNILCYSSHSSPCQRRRVYFTTEFALNATLVLMRCSLMVTGLFSEPTVSI